MKFQRPFLILFILVLIVPLILHSYFGLYSRYLADDFCTAAQYRSLGFLPSMQSWRTTWSGRFSFFFFMNITHLIGPWITPYLTAIVLIIWLIALVVLIGQFIHSSNSTLFTLLFALIILFATLDGSPDIYQSLYWQTGLVTYVFPLLFFTIYGVLILRRVSKETKIKWGEKALSAGITFVAGGFSETYLSFQIVAILAFLLIIYLFAKGESRRSGIILLGWGLLGAILALILVTTASGNSVRLDAMPDRLSAPEMAFWTLRHSVAFSVKSLINSPVSFLIALLVPGLLSFFLPISQNANETSPIPPRNKIIPIFVGIPILAFLLIVVSIAPSVYVTAAYPAERVLITTQFILIFAITSWSFLFGLTLRGYFGKLANYSTPICVFIVLLLISGAMISSQKTLSRLPDARTFASLWDERDGNIRQAVASGVQELSIVSLPHISSGLGEISKDPDDWINQCLAVSYGLTKVIAK